MKIKPVIDIIVVCNLAFIALITLWGQFGTYTYEDLRTAVNWYNYLTIASIVEYVAAYWWTYLVLLNVALMFYFSFHAILNKKIHILIKILWVVSIILIPLSFTIYWYIFSYRANDA